MTQTLVILQTAWWMHLQQKSLDSLLIEIKFTTKYNLTSSLAFIIRKLMKKKRNFCDILVAQLKKFGRLFRVDFSKLGQSTGTLHVHDVEFENHFYSFLIHKITQIQLLYFCQNCPRMPIKRMHHFTCLISKFCGGGGNAPGPPSMASYPSDARRFVHQICIRSTMTTINGGPNVHHQISTFRIGCK